MGNCWGSTPVTNHNSPSATKPSTPKTSANHSKENGPGGRSSSDRKEKESVRIGVYVENKDKDGTARTPPSGQVMAVLGPKLFTLSELKSATRNFRPDTVLGEGGFGRVFKGWVDEKTFAPAKVGCGMAVAVKKSKPDSSQGLQEWQSEVKLLGKFSHPNLVRLLGYCWEENQFLLVYEYMQKGSLETHLFRKGAEPLPWNVRIKIAIGAAEGLSFLHTSEKSVIYRDFKTSNILLDGAFNAKLSDFGLAKFGPLNGNSHVTTRVMGTYGYAAPEYVATGHLYVKSDVFGFGVVLLELLTGLKALDTNRPSWQQNLVEFARPSLSDKRKLKKIMDPRLEEQYPIKAAVQAAGLILQCLESDPRSRPSMKEVLETLKKIDDTKDVSKDSKGSAKKKAPKRQEEHYRHQSPLQSRHGGTGNKGRAHSSASVGSYQSTGAPRPLYFASHL
ncbi:hypothetical protein D5086_011722 [Populus alba]|uniref:Uncharacterized protein n=2 Tax=Populus TaxID=3689 RepID=A0ACC4CFI8_POPAL|nr:probable serine/threonine-protein kinase PIX13 [Populus alba]KAJ6998982.1 serine/threonine-protein kinase PIX13 [Populus alba x Populus x berolinensis]